MRSATQCFCVVTHMLAVLRAPYTITVSTHIQLKKTDLKPKTTLQVTLCRPLKLFRMWLKCILCWQSVCVYIGHSKCVPLIWHGYQSNKAGKTMFTKNLSNLHVICIKKTLSSHTTFCSPWERIFYHVLRVPEKLLARHAAEVVHLQSTWLFHNIVIRVVGPESIYIKKKSSLILQLLYAN